MFKFWTSLDNEIAEQGVVTPIDLVGENKRTKSSIEVKLRESVTSARQSGQGQKLNLNSDLIFSK